MKFKVVGQNKDTGARMALEFEAESKAAAERKAIQSGMTVNHVTDITDGGGSGLAADYRGPIKQGGGLIKFAVIVVILAVAAWYFWAKIKRMIH